MPSRYPCAPCNSTPENPLSAIRRAASTNCLVTASISPRVISRGAGNRSLLIMPSNSPSPMVNGIALGAIVDAKIPLRPAPRIDWRPGWQSCTMDGVPCCWHASAYLLQVSTSTAFCSFPVYSADSAGSNGLPRWLISTWTFPIASVNHVYPWDKLRRNDLKISNPSGQNPILPCPIDCTPRPYRALGHGWNRPAFRPLRPIFIC